MLCIFYLIQVKTEANFDIALNRAIFENIDVDCSYEEMKMFTNETDSRHHPSPSVQLPQGPPRVPETSIWSIQF